MKTILPLNGGINKDVNPLYVDSQKGEVVGRKNCRVFSVDGSRVGINASIKGMEEVSAGLPSGTNQVIGYVEDKERSIGIFFNWNSNDDDGIYLFDGDTVTDLGVANGVLGLNRNYPVDADVIGEWCVCTDNLNPPRKFRITTSAGDPRGTNALSSETADSLMYARKHPEDAPTVSTGTDTTKKVNKLVGRSFQFAVYHVYDDYTYSVLSPYSEIAVSPAIFDSEYNTYEDNNTGNVINVTYLTGGSTVGSAVLVAREGNTGSWFKVEEYEKTASETTRTVSFYNDVAREYIPIDKALSLYSDVPLLAKSVVSVQNRIGFGGVTKGYDTDFDFDYELSIEYETVEVELNSDSLTIDTGVSDPVAYIDITMPDTVDLVSGNTVYISLDGTYAVYDKIFFYFEYYGSYTVQDGDDQQDIIDYFVSDINSKSTTIVSRLVTGSPVGLEVSGRYIGSDVRIEFAGAYDTGDDYVFNFFTQFAAHTTQPTGVSTYKSGSYYNVGVALYDSRSRTTGVTKVQRVYVPHNGERAYADAFDRARIKFDITDYDLPSWADHLRFAVTESVNFAGVYPFIVGNDDSSNIYDDIYLDGKQVIAINLPTNLQYEFVSGDWLQLEVDSGAAITTIVKTIIGTRTILDIDGTEESGFWLIVPKGDETISSYDGVLATIYRPKNEVSDLIYYEDYTTYDITSGSLSVDEGYVGSGDAWYVSRAFQWPDGATGTTEEVEVVEDFYLDVDSAVRAYSKGRALVEFDTQGQITLQDFVWSEPYLDNTKINGLAFFDSLSRKQLDEKHGDIQRIELVGDVLKVFQDHKETSMYIGKQQISNADGTLSLVSVNNFVGTVRPMQTSYGTQHPLSVSSYNRSSYYWDQDNGQVIRSAPNGQMPISDYGMKSEFLRIKNDIDDASSVRVISYFDSKNDEFVITFYVDSTAETFVFKEDSDVWIMNDYELTNSSGVASDIYGNLSNMIVGFLGGSVWKFEQGSSYNTFFGDSKELSVTGVLNIYPNEEKCLRGLLLDSNRAADTEITSPVANTRTVGQKTVLYPETYRSREGGYTSAVFGNILKAGGVEDLSLLHSGTDMVGKHLAIQFTDSGTTEFQLRLVTVVFSINR